MVMVFIARTVHKVYEGHEIVMLEGRGIRR